LLDQQASRVVDIPLPRDFSRGDPGKIGDLFGSAGRILPPAGCDDESDTVVVDGQVFRYGAVYNFTV
jgi:hypothetical protein